VTAPLGIYGAALRRAHAGQYAALAILGPDGVELGQLDAAHWTADLRGGDQSLLDRCAATTLDVGCGPGRLAAALLRRGSYALGVDVSPEAVRQAARRGVSAVCGSVFGPLPREGRWDTILLADGNIGIGGDPHALLRRCAMLLGAGGRVLAEVDPPGRPSWAGQVVLRDGPRRSHPFPWARVAQPDARVLGDRSGLTLFHTWSEAGRWFVEFGPA
jgi:SAM-dependent methyltransferase